MSVDYTDCKYCNLPNSKGEENGLKHVSTLQKTNCWELATARNAPDISVVLFSLAHHVWPVQALTHAI